MKRSISIAWVLALVVAAGGCGKKDAGPAPSGGTPDAAGPAAPSADAAAPGAAPGMPGMAPPGMPGMAPPGAVTAAKPAEAKPDEKAAPKGPVDDSDDPFSGESSGKKTVVGALGRALLKAAPSALGGAKPAEKKAP